MATKTIVSVRTLHVPAKTFDPFVFSDRGIATKGKYDIVAVKPGTPVEIDSDDADVLIDAGFAELYASSPAPEKIVSAKKKGASSDAA